MINIVFLFSLPRSGSRLLSDVAGTKCEVILVFEALHPELLEEENNLFGFILKNSKNPSDVVKNIYRSEIFFDYINYLKEKYPNKSVIIDIKVSSFHHVNGAFFSPISPPKLITLVEEWNSQII